MAHWQRFVHKPQTKKLKFCKEIKMKEKTQQCQQKGSSSLIPRKVIGRTITGPYPKLLQPWLIKFLIELLMDFSAEWETSDRLIWHHVALCFLSEMKEQKFIHDAHTAQQPRCTTHCTTTKVHILHNNCLKMQSGRAARKKGQKILLSREKILLKERTGENSLGWINFFITTNILPCTTMSFMNSFDSKTVLKASLK